MTNVAGAIAGFRLERQRTRGRHRLDDVCPPHVTAGRWAVLDYVAVLVADGDVDRDDFEVVERAAGAMRGLAVSCFNTA